MVFSALLNAFLVPCRVLKDFSWLLVFFERFLVVSIMFSSFSLSLTVNLQTSTEWGTCMGLVCLSSLYFFSQVCLDAMCTLSMCSFVVLNLFLVPFSGLPSIARSTNHLL